MSSPHLSGALTPPRWATEVALTVIAVLTALSAVVLWCPLVTGPTEWLVTSALVGLAVATIGAVARISGRIGMLALLAQALIVLAATAWSSGLAPWAFVSTPQDFHAELTAAIDFAAVAPPPASASAIAPLLVGATGLILIVMDFLVGKRRPLLAGLLIVGCSAVLLVDDPLVLPWWQIAVPVTLWALLLIGCRPRQRRGAPVVAPVGATPYEVAIALSAVALVGASAVLVPIVVEPETRAWNGSGAGASARQVVSVANPMVTLRRQLNRGVDVPLMRVETNDPSPSYLRVAVLKVFRDDAWTPGERSIPSSNGPSDSLPSLLGMSDNIEVTSYDYTVQANPSFRSRWLPTQAPITSLRTDGDWRYDDETLDFIAVDEDLDTRGQRWEMTAASLRLTREYLEERPTSLSVGREFVALPDSFPDSIRTLAEEVTDGHDTAMSKATALQRWFRSEGGFVYDTATPAGDSPGDLETFLSTAPGGRVGYCQQFAAAMAAMARSLGIPARVAVGFLTPERSGPTSWVYSAHDFHAWPELYFQGAGWVRFEPTPPARGTSIPSYTEPIRSDDGPDEALPEESTNSATRAPTTNSAPTTAENSADQTSTETDGDPASAWLWGTVTLLICLSALTIPLGLRAQRRRRRRSHATPEAGWNELRDAAIDHGVRWPNGASPRVQAQAVADWLGPEAPAEREALARLLEAIEQERFGSHAPGPARWSDVDELSRALSAQSSRAGRALSHWMPASVVGRPNHGPKDR